MTADIGALLRFDPLDAAEDITGLSYKEDGATMSLGVVMALLHNERKADVLRSQDDTHYGTAFDDALRIYGELGFTQIHSREFEGRTAERFVVLWRDGVLATAESYNSTSLNSTKIYYNWRPAAGVHPFEYTSSGRLKDGVWSGDHDAREGLRHTLSRLESAGELLPFWVERPWLWFLSYADSDVEGYSYKDINAAVSASFPSDVIAAITPGNS